MQAEGSPALNQDSVMVHCVPGTALASVGAGQTWSLLPWALDPGKDVVNEQFLKSLMSQISEVSFQNVEFPDLANKSNMMPYPTQKPSPLNGSRRERRKSIPVRGKTHIPRHSGREAAWGLSESKI